LARVLDREDWNGCPAFGDADLRLQEVKLDTWAGFVFINMDASCEPLQEFLKPMPQYLNCYEFEKWRFRWYKTTILPCNWKTALEGFNESYHVATTHPQLLARMGDDLTRSVAMGRHGMYYYPLGQRTTGMPSPRTGRPIPPDIRGPVVEFYDQMRDTLRAMFSPRSVEATHRLLTEVEPSNDPSVVLPKMVEFQKQAAIASGAGWPAITPQQQIEAGINWHLFPNHVFLMLPDASIAYRARPNGDDPDTCIFDIWSLERFAPGAEPPLKREFIADYAANTVEDFGRILSQDFQNFGPVQQGMKSRGFRGLRTNPLQESEITNMHSALYQYLFD
jgi:phenylpropionate dioxygenase-like ring-hydroxylating dioxygenase large terminal subunit